MNLYRIASWFYVLIGLTLLPLMAVDLRWHDNALTVTWGIMLMLSVPLMIVQLAGLRRVLQERADFTASHALITWFWILHLTTLALIALVAVLFYTEQWIWGIVALLAGAVIIMVIGIALGVVEIMLGNQFAVCPHSLFGLRRALQVGFVVLGGLEIASMLIILTLPFYIIVTLALSIITALVIEGHARQARLIDFQRRHVVASYLLSVIFGLAAPAFIVGPMLLAWDDEGEAAAQAAVSESELVTVGQHRGGNNDSYQPAISADGRYVVFTSYATDLMESENDNLPQVFMRDMVDNKTLLVSQSLTGKPSDGDASDPEISADGRYVAFLSSSTDIVSDDSNGVADVFVRDMRQGSTQRVNVSSSGAQADGRSYELSMSSDGRYVTFNSEATTLREGNHQQVLHTFIHDRQDSITQSLSYTHGHQAIANGYSGSAQLSGDGRQVVEYTYATNLFGENSLPDDGQLVIRWLDSGEVAPVSVSTAGEFADSDVLSYSVSGNGRYVVFESRAGNLGAGEETGDIELYLHDTVNKSIRWLDLKRFDSDEKYCCYILGGTHSLSGDGRYLAVLANYDETPAAIDSAADIVVYDIKEGHLQVVATATRVNGSWEEYSSLAFSADGRYLAYTSDATKPTLNGARHSLANIYRVRNPLVP